MKYILAPLAGFTDSAFRMICREHGAAGAYTEMVSAAGLKHDSIPTRILLETHPAEIPPAVQIFGSSADDVAYAAAEIDKISREREKAGLGAFAELNLNAGCPMPRIRHEGSGAALVKNPAKVAEMLQAMKRETSLPVTLKTRLGPWPEEPTYLELLDAAETSGAAAIIVHARFVRGIHSGPLYYELLAEIVAKAKIPVVGNGGVVDRASAKSMAATGVSAIMVARGATANPWIFDELLDENAPPSAELRTRRWKDTFLENIRLEVERFDYLKEKYPQAHLDADAYVMNHVRTHLARYVAGIPGAKELRRAVAAQKSIRELLQTISDTANNTT